MDGLATIANDLQNLHANQVDDVCDDPITPKAEICYRLLGGHERILCNAHIEDPQREQRRRKNYQNQNRRKALDCKIGSDQW